MLGFLQGGGPGQGFMLSVLPEHDPALVTHRLRDAPCPLHNVKGVCWQCLSISLSVHGTWSPRGSPGGGFMGLQDWSNTVMCFPQATVFFNQIFQLTEINTQKEPPGGKNKHSWRGTSLSAHDYIDNQPFWIFSNERGQNIFSNLLSVLKWN